MGRAFPRKECLRLSREGEVSQVKKADRKEEKAPSDKRAGPSYATLGSWGFIPSATVLDLMPGNQVVISALILLSGDTEEVDGKKKKRGRAKC